MRKMLRILMVIVGMACLISCRSSDNTNNEQVYDKLPDTGYKMLDPQDQLPLVFAASKARRPDEPVGKKLLTDKGFEFARTDSPSDLSSPGHGDFSISGSPASLVVIDSPHNRPVLDNSSMPTGIYRLSGKTENMDDIWPTIVNSLEKNFNVSIKPTFRELRVWVLSTEHGETPDLKATTQSKGTRSIAPRRTHWKCRGYTMQVLSRDLAERCLGWIVVDETGLTDRYDFDLPVISGEPVTVISGIRRLGLRLKMEKRKIDVVAIEDAENRR